MPEFFDRHRRPPSPPDTEAHARALFEHALALHTDFTQAPAAHKIPRLVEAIQYYQEALRTYTERAFPVHWAATMANLASLDSHEPHGT